MWVHAGFHGDGRRQVRKAAEAAGAEYSGDLQKDVTTHLVVSETAGAAASAKLQRAAEWGIPSLQWAWLKQSAARGRLMPTGLYLYSGAEPSSSDAAKRPQTPFQDSAPAADGAAQRSPAVLPSTSAEDRLQQHKRCDTAACAARANASSSAFATAGSHSEERPAAGQDNLTPQPHSATAAPHSYSPERAADQAEALAAELQGLQVRSSPLDRGALASIQHASDRQLLDEPLAAAPSQAGSCMCSAGSDDDGIHCAQGAPGQDYFMLAGCRSIASLKVHERTSLTRSTPVGLHEMSFGISDRSSGAAASGDHRGTPLKLPSPAQQRRSDAGMRADVAGPQSPEASISAAAAASPGVDTKSHMVPSTVASSSQVSSSLTLLSADVMFSRMQNFNRDETPWSMCAVKQRCDCILSCVQDLWSSPPAGSVRRMMPLRPSPSVHLPGKALTALIACT